MKKPFQTYYTDSQISNGKALLSHELRRRRILIYLAILQKSGKMHLTNILINNLNLNRKEKK